MTEKETRLAVFCRDRNLDGVFLRRRSNIAWLTDGADVHVDSGSPLGIAAVLWTPARKLVITDNIEAPRLRAEEFGPDWEIRARDWWEPRGAGGGGLPTRDASLPAGNYATDWPDDHIAELRFSLTDSEVARVRTLGHDAAAALSGALRAVNRGGGDTEHHLAALIAAKLRDRAILAPVLLVAADDRLRSFRHPIPTDRKIDRVVMAAICAQRRGLIVSATRLVHFGPLPEDLRRRHDAVCRVDSALHQATRPGARWCDLFALAQKSYADLGFPDEWKLHHQGGPMGYELRDFKATPTETRGVVENQLVGWNPTITGTKSEDTILATARAHEVVTATSDWPIGPHGRPDVLVRPA